MMMMIPGLTSQSRLFHSLSVLLLMAEKGLISSRDQSIIVLLCIFVINLDGIMQLDGNTQSQENTIFKRNDIAASSS